MIVKCQHCGLKDMDRKEMAVLVKYNKNHYFHPDCYEKYLVMQQFQEKEQSELDELYQYVMKLYGLTVFPKNLMTKLQDLRNGTDRYKRNRIINYKGGISFPVILKSYKLSADSIVWARQNKRFENIEKEIAYGFAIMMNKINDAQRTVVREERAAKREIAKAEIEIECEPERAAVYKRKKSKIDISDFLE